MTPKEFKEEVTKRLRSKIQEEQLAISTQTEGRVREAFERQKAYYFAITTLSEVFEGKD